MENPGGDGHGEARPARPSAGGAPRGFALALSLVLHAAAIIAVATSVRAPRREDFLIVEPKLVVSFDKTAFDKIYRQMAASTQKLESLAEARAAPEAALAEASGAEAADQVLTAPPSAAGADLPADRLSAAAEVGPAQAPAAAPEDQAEPAPPPARAAAPPAAPESLPEIAPPPAQGAAPPAVPLAAPAAPPPAVPLAAPGAPPRPAAPGAAPPPVAAAEIRPSRRARPVEDAPPRPGSASIVPARAAPAVARPAARLPPLHHGLAATPAVEATPPAAAPRPADRPPGLAAAPIGPETVGPTTEAPGEVVALATTAEPADARPGPAGGGAPPPGDERAVTARIDAVLGGIDCGRVLGRLSGLPGALALSGHVPSDSERARLRAALLAIAGIRRVEDGNVVVLPPPHCRVLDFLDRASLTRSSDQTASMAMLGAPARPDIRRFRVGETLSFALTAPDFAAHVYVDYYDGAGNVLHLMPSVLAPRNRFAPGERFRIGGDPAAPYRIVIEPPFGTDIVVALGASGPLFEGPRPRQEPAQAYLEALARVIAEARRRDPAFAEEYSYIFVITEP